MSGLHSDVIGFKSMKRLNSFSSIEPSLIADVRLLFVSAMRKLSKPWTDDENRRLIEVVDAGISAERAASIFKRTVTGIRSHAHKLGRKFPIILARRRAMQDAERPAEIARSVFDEKNLQRSETVNIATVGLHDITMEF